MFAMQEKIPPQNLAFNNNTYTRILEIRIERGSPFPEREAGRRITFKSRDIKSEILSAPAFLSFPLR
jgi:hypothetical protein